jgi:hypothetical protein
MVHVLFECGWTSLPVCINNTGSAAFKHFDPLMANSSVHTWQSVVNGSLPLSFLGTKRRTIASCLSLLQTCSGAVIFTPCSLGTGGLQLNHTCRMSPCDLELQHDQVSAVLPIIKRKYSNILTFWISFVIYESWICVVKRHGNVFQHCYNHFCRT